MGVGVRGLAFGIQVSGFIRFRYFWFWVSCFSDYIAGGCRDSMSSHYIGVLGIHVILRYFAWISYLLQEGICLAPQEEHFSFLAGWRLGLGELRSPALLHHHRADLLLKVFLFRGHSAWIT